MTPPTESVEVRLAGAIRLLLQKHTRHATAADGHAFAQQFVARIPDSQEVTAILEDSRKALMHAGVMYAAAIDDVVAELSAAITAAVREGVREGLAQRLPDPAAAPTREVEA